MNIEVDKSNMKIVGNDLVIGLTPDLRKTLGLEKICVGDIAVGETFYGGKYIVVGQWLQCETHVVCLEPIRGVVFGDTNDYRSSNLRKKLNNEYRLELENIFGIGSLIERRISLYSLDGLEDYDIIVDKVAPLTFDEYRVYRKDIGFYAEGEWTCTPWSTPSASGEKHDVVYIDYDGSIGAASCVESMCVRPIFTLKSSTKVQK